MARRIAAAYQMEPLSALASWTRRLAVFSLIATIVSVIIVRFGFLDFKPTAFAAIVLGQLANAYACRSVSRPVWRTGLRGNRLLLWAVAFELAVLVVFLFVPPLPELLGGHGPSALGWALAAATVPVVVLADAAVKAVLARRVSSVQRAQRSLTP